MDSSGMKDKAEILLEGLSWSMAEDRAKDCTTARGRRG